MFLIPLKRVIYIKKIVAKIFFAFPLIILAAFLLVAAYITYINSFIIISLFFEVSFYIYLCWLIICLVFDVGIVNRLTTFFVEIKVPLMHKHLLVQKADRKTLKHMTCREVYVKLAKEKVTLPKSLRTDCEYSLTTHQTVINHLQKSGIVAETGIKKYGSGFNSSLRTEQKQLIGKRCKKCLYGQTCYYKRKAQMKRRFFIIKFRTKSASLSLET